MKVDDLLESSDLKPSTLYIYQSIPAKNVAVTTPGLKALAKMVHAMKKNGSSPAALRKVTDAAKRLGFKSEIGHSGRALASDLSLRWVDEHGKNRWLDKPTVVASIDEYLEESS